MYPIRRKNVIGGHVVKGKVSEKADEGDTVFIIPICYAHNNNDNYYMKTRQRTFVVELYYRAKTYAYLAQRPLETHEKI